MWPSTLPRNWLRQSNPRDSVLKDRRFLRLWVGTTCSGLATWALPFLLGLGLIEGDLTAASLGVLLSVRTVGFLAAVPVAGVLADRHPRRRVVGLATLIAATATWGLALTWSDSLPLAVVCTFAVGIGQGACRPALQALLAEVVREPRRQSANALTSLAVRGSVVVAPGITAALSLVTDLVVILAGTGLLWLVAALLPPAGSDTRRPSEGTPASYAAEIRAGLEEAHRHPWFLPGLGALSVVVMLGYSTTAVALPVVSQERYGGGGVLTASVTAFMVGGVLGSLLLARWRPGAAGWWALGGLAAYAVAPLGLAVHPAAAVLVVAYLVAGLGNVMFNVPWFTATQREVDPAMLARVSSVDFLVSYGLAPVGLALIGPAMALVGATPTFLLCSAACLIAPLLAARVAGSRQFTQPAG